MEFITDRVESHMIDKARKLILICGVGGLIITIMKVLTKSEIKITGLGWWFDTLIIGLIPTYLLIKNYKNLTKRTGQYIDWQGGFVIYKLKENETPITLGQRRIKDIRIALEIIEIIDVDNKTYKLDISDFGNYETRIRIKNNFTKMKNYCTSQVYN